MLDIRFIRDNPDLVQKNAQNKGYDVSIADLLQLDQEKRDVATKVEALRERRNTLSSQMKGGRPSDEAVAEGKALKEQLSTLEDHYREVDVKFTSIIKKVPNMAAADVPYGASEDENVIMKEVGEPREV